MSNTTNSKNERMQGITNFFIIIKYEKLLT